MMQDNVIGMLSNDKLRQREVERLGRKDLKIVRVKNFIPLPLRIQLMKNYGYDVVCRGKKTAS